MRLLVFLGAVSAALLRTVSAADRSTAPAGAITVGSGGDFSTVQAAIDSLSVSDTAAQTIFIFAGTYKEQVDIAARKSILTIYGQTTDTTSYTNNVVNIEFSCSQLDCASTNDATATVSNHAEGTKFYNINIKNTYGKGSQAVALSAYAGSQGYYGVGLYGYQDTLLAQTGTQLYAKSMIQGATDFIFGQKVQAWIDNSDLRINGIGYITASGRSTDDSGYYVINNCDVAVDSTVSLSAGSTYLGRPWRNYARVIFQNTKLSDVVNAAGWSIWSTGDERTDHVEFAEFGNSGAGAATGGRAAFSEQLGAAVGIATVLGSDYADWVDASYLS